MGQEHSKLGGRVPDTRNPTQFPNVAGPPPQHFSMASSSRRQLAQLPLAADRSRRRPLASLYCSEPVPSATSGNRTGNDENRPSRLFTANRVPTQSTFGALPSPIALPAPPQEPRNKMLKLEMNIDSSDGKISGNVFIGDTQTTADAQAILCGGCKSPLANNGGGGGQGGVAHSRLVEQMNRQFDREAHHLLYKIQSELMTTVGTIDCYKMTGMVAERKRIQEEVFHRIGRPDIFDGIRRYRTAGILLYGPPGNGKTFMAKLIAGHVSHRYINVQPYYLDSPMAYQLLIAIFRLASSQNEPTVIVFDNIDQIFHRKDNLQELFASEFSRSVQRQDNIVVIGTTRMFCYHNLPKKIADCFEHRIEISLPNEKERGDLISTWMGSVRHNLTKSNIKAIAEATVSRTRGQIEAICRKAASISALEVPNEMIRTAIPSSVRPVNIEDFVTVLRLRNFPNSPEPINDVSSSMEISSTESSQETSGDDWPFPPAGAAGNGDDMVEVELH